MEEELTPSDEGEVCLVSSIYRAGDTVVFKYEGNVRARVEGSEVVGGRVRLRCRPFIGLRSLSAGGVR